MLEVIISLILSSLPICFIKKRGDQERKQAKLPEYHTQRAKVTPSYQNSRHRYQNSVMLCIDKNPPEYAAFNHSSGPETDPIYAFVKISSAVFVMMWMMMLYTC
jgi:hypothetical protein